jgi:UDPglucose 6-dehydrogenase
MNEIANLCDRTGADVNRVRHAIATDRRIGASFLFPGLGYGGSCFRKDVQALINLARENDYPLKLIQAVEEVNELQKHIMIHKIVDFYSSDTGKKQDDDHSPVKGKTFAIWGLAFKPQTDDMREAPSRVIIEQLLSLGAKIQAYDPEAMKEARKIFGNKIRYAKNNYEALKGADALILVTEWNEFRNPDFKKMKALLKDPVIFDGRNQYSRREMRELGFDYVGVGRPSPA